MLLLLSYILKNNHRTEKQKQSYKHAGMDCSSKAISAYIVYSSVQITFIVSNV